MDLESFIEAADAWVGLGWAVQEQVHDLIAYDFDYGSLNENAIRMIARFADYLYNDYGIDTDELHAAIAMSPTLSPETPNLNRPGLSSFLKPSNFRLEAKINFSFAPPFFAATCSSRRTATAAGVFRSSDNASATAVGGLSFGKRK